MNEIVIAQQGILKCDFETMKAKLNEKLELYKKMVFTEEAKTEAKKVVAELRKDKKEFTEEVKAIKAEYMKPYEAFYAQACEVIDLYDEPISFINEQIEAFEAQRIEAKKQEIKAIYTELVPEEDFIDLIPLQRIYNPKWENATFTAKQIKEEILGIKVKVKQELEIIQAYDSDAVGEAVARYKASFDLSASIKFLQDYEAQRKLILEAEEAKRKAEEEARIRAEERAKIEAEMKAEAEKAEAVAKAQAEIIESLIPTDSFEQAYEYTYIIKMTKEAKEKLEMYMNSIGIEFEELPI